MVAGDVSWTTVFIKVSETCALETFIPIPAFENVNVIQVRIFSWKFACNALALLLYCYIRCHRSVCIESLFATDLNKLVKLVANDSCVPISSRMEPDYYGLEALLELLNDFKISIWHFKGQFVLTTFTKDHEPWQSY